MKKTLLISLCLTVAMCGVSAAEMPSEAPSSPQTFIPIATEATPTAHIERRWIHPYSFALRTNLLYDALLVPTLGVEWRANKSIGVKLDGSFAWWGSETDKVQQIWFISPEVRWYMGGAKLFYVGLGGSYGDYNSYKHLLNRIYNYETGYQGTLYNVGVTVGYQLPIVCGKLLLDFNVGGGFNHTHYDTFTVQSGVRNYTSKNSSKNSWGLTQAGVSLVYTFGSGK